MNKITVMTIVGTRPEIIKLSEVMKELDKHTNHIIVHTGQNYDYELNELFFEQLNVRTPDYFLEAVKGSPSETIGDIIAKSDKILSKIKPDAILVYGDTNSCLSVIPAKKRKIPIFHMEAGNRCFDQRVPEETNRKIVDHISDINLTYSDIAREYLLREGLLPDRVIKTGSPMFEVLNHYKSSILNSNILKKLDLEKSKYFLVSAHREENINSEKNFNDLINSLNQISEIYDFPVIFSTHPRTYNKLSQTKITTHKNIRILKPLGFFDYNNLQINSKAVLSDSGTISEESSIMNFPALNIREAHERPEAMEEASVMMVGLNPDRILQGLRIILNQKRGIERTVFPVADYSKSNVSEKVLRIIVSYTDYIKRNVWHEW